jgi:hypothetical protein
MSASLDGSQAGELEREGSCTAACIGAYANRVFARFTNARKEQGVGGAIRAIVVFVDHDAVDIHEGNEGVKFFRDGVNRNLVVCL